VILRLPEKQAGTIKCVRLKTIPAGMGFLSPLCEMKLSRESSTDGSEQIDATAHFTAESRSQMIRTFRIACSNSEITRGSPEE
jgi:hypothetical protein